LKWQKFLGFYSGALQPIVDADGNIYTSNTSNQIIAFDQEGNQKWALPLYGRSDFLSLDKDGTLFIPGQTYLYLIGP
jgi:outer membrane protein assembly factor BamB